jgi:hypothetical protein
LLKVADDCRLAAEAIEAIEAIEAQSPRRPFASAVQALKQALSVTRVSNRH